MESPQTPTPTPPPALVLALRRVLRPLVRLMLARAITYPYLCELLKALFVEVADRDFRIGSKVPTDSRVSLVTGVHRKEVNRLRQEMSSDTETVPSVVSLGAQLVAVWLGSARYLNEDGQPRPLARFVSEGGELSFEALVAGVNSDIRPRVVLDEWLRLGVVHFDEERRVCLNVQAFVPAEGFDEKAFTSATTCTTMRRQRPTISAAPASRFWNAACITTRWAPTPSRHWPRSPSRSA